MSLFSTGSRAVFESAERAWLEPPDDEPEAPTLPDHGTCPECRKELAWDGKDDTKAWCPTPGCKYDNGLSEEENRRLWKEQKK